MVLISNVIMMLLLALFMALANYSFTESHRGPDWYLFDKDAPSSAAIAGGSFFSFYLVLNSFVPLELVIIMEFSKFLSTMFM